MNNYQNNTSNGLRLGGNIVALVVASLTILLGVLSAIGMQYLILETGGSETYIALGLILIFYILIPVILIIFNCISLSKKKFAFDLAAGIISVVLGIFFMYQGFFVIFLLLFGLAYLVASGLCIAAAIKAKKDADNSQMVNMYNNPMSVNQNVQQPVQPQQPMQPQQPVQPNINDFQNDNQFN